MARKKVSTPSIINSWDDVDKAFADITSCELEIDEVNVELNRKALEIKTDAELQAKPHYERIKLLEAAVKEFVTKNREDIDGKTKTLNNGSTGFRLSTSLVIPKLKVADIIASLKRLKMTDCISVKETVNKDVLKRYPTDKILVTGAYMKSADEFWYEIEKQDVKSVE